MLKSCVDCDERIQYNIPWYESEFKQKSDIINTIH
jgi:hypothetical protein